MILRVLESIADGQTGLIPLSDAAIEEKTEPKFSSDIKA
jgi:hypothetical protein